MVRQALSLYMWEIYIRANVSERERVMAFPFPHGDCRVRNSIRGAHCASSLSLSQKFKWLVTHKEKFLFILFFCLFLNWNYTIWLTRKKCAVSISYIYTYKENSISLRMASVRISPSLCSLNFPKGGTYTTTKRAGGETLKIEVRCRSDDVIASLCSFHER